MKPKLKDQSAYQMRRVTHRNLATLLAAMKVVGATSVEAHVSSHAADGGLQHDMSYSFGSNFDETAPVEQVEIERLSIDEDGGFTLRSEKKDFREAVRDVMRDILQVTAPDWRDADWTTGRVALTAKWKEFQGAAVNLKGKSYGAPYAVQSRFSHF